MNGFVTKANLQAGIGGWKKEWPADFHNRLYSELLQLRQNGLDSKWWQEIVDVLSDWKAMRPKSKEWINERGLERLTQLNEQYNLILMGNDNREPDLAAVDWEQLVALFNSAASIKNVASPVFGSKLCHFIFPSAFPVVDREFVGIRGGYEVHWFCCKAHWIECEEKEELMEILKRAINPPILPGYPWATKITELCLIGRSSSH